MAAPPPIDWCVSQGRRELAQFTLTDSNAVASDYGRLAFQRVEIVPDIVANIVEIESRIPFELTSNLESQGDRICLQATLAGHCSLNVEDGVNTGYQNGMSDAHGVRGTTASFRFPAGSCLRTLSFTYSRDTFDDRLSGAVPDALRVLLHEPSDPQAHARLRTPSMVQRIIDAAFHEKLIGPLQKMQIDGMSRIMMARFIAGFSGNGRMTSDREITGCFRDRLHDIRDRILANPVDLPSLDDLARDAGVDHKRLNTGFRKLFGTTIFEFCRNHRLDGARISLLEGNAAMKEVAYEAGYAHVSNFVTAYRRRFGSTPGMDQSR